MVVTVKCPKCNYQAEASGNFVGKNVKCRVCNERFVVPEADSQSASDPNTSEPIPNRQSKTSWNDEELPEVTTSYRPVPHPTVPVFLHDEDLLVTKSYFEADGEIIPIRAVATVALGFRRKRSIWDDSRLIVVLLFAFFGLSGCFAAVFATTNAKGIDGLSVCLGGIGAVFLLFAVASGLRVFFESLQNQSKHYVVVHLLDRTTRRFVCPNPSYAQRVQASFTQAIVANG